MSDNPYQAPQENGTNATMTSYLVQLLALVSVVAGIGLLRMTTDMSTAFAMSAMVLVPLLAMAGAFKSEISDRVWKPLTAFPQILMSIASGLLVVSGLMHLMGIKPKYDGMPAVGWCQLLFVVTMWCRVAQVRYEMWSERREPTDTDKRKSSPA